jgi:enoyl-CoA hydratase/carnithine racemase
MLGQLTSNTESEMSTETLSSSPPELNTLRIEIDGEIGTLTLDRPDAFNAMSPEMIGEMTVAFAWLADRSPLRALIITGSGKAFCAGGDVNWFQRGVEDDEIDLPSEVRRGAEALHAAIVDLRRIPYPVIAAVNGPAAGAGFSLALACDIRIASEYAFFACAYGRIGASPDGGMTYFLPRVVGPSRALELLIEDPDLKAADALAEGLVSEVVAADELVASAQAKAEKLAAKAPYYVRMAKRLCGQSIENSLTEHLQLERHGIADSMATEDLRNGVEAFFGGGKPEFKGR